MGLKTGNYAFQTPQRTPKLSRKYL
jgi:hypothetical protein